MPLTRHQYDALMLAAYDHGRQHELDRLYAEYQVAYGELCPECGNTIHKDGTLDIVDEGDGHYHCFNCDWYWSNES